MAKPISIPDALKAWRKRRKLTQNQAALIIGVQKETYINWEYGRNEPQHLAKEAMLQKIK